MALISPILDDRSFDDLKRELVERIPAYTPEWTDDNESDPGIALLELFAFLGENLLYRFNQIPDSTKIAFLRLLDVQLPGPATSSTVLVAAQTDAPKGVQMLRGTGLKAGNVPFETTYELQAWPLTALGAAKLRAATDGLSAYESERRQEARRRAQLNENDPATFYEPVMVPGDPTTGAPVDIQRTADGALWIALSRTRSTDRRELAGGSAYIGIAVDESIPGTDGPQVPQAVRPAGRLQPETPGQIAAEDARQSTSVIEQGIVLPEGAGYNSDSPTMRWRLWQGPAVQDRGQASPWLPLTVLHDTTRGLTATGVVQIELPVRLEPPPESAGGTDDPPPLPDPKQAEAVELWLQVSRPDTVTTPGSGADSGPAPMPRVAWVGVNAVEAEQVTTVTVPELLGVGTGDLGQSFPLSKQQILADTVDLDVDEVGGWRRWDEVDDVDQQPDGTRCFSVDRAAGIVHFADSNGPRVPQIGERIRVVGYRFGGGTAGNVAARTITKAVGVSGNVKISNPLPATGGGDAQSVLDAFDLIPRTVHRRDRAVTPDDFQALAADIPNVARAEALPLFDPAHPKTPAAGVVTVVVFPQTDLRTPDTPTPDRSLLRDVALHLDARRLLTTEVVVAPPEYVDILLSVGVHVRPGYQVDAVRRWVELLLRQYLAPLPTYGPDGHGWPLGRTVRKAELAAVAVQVDGVEYLQDLLLARMVAGAVQEADEVPLERWQVPSIGAVTVVVGSPPAPSAPDKPSPTGPSVIPLPAEVCP